MYRFRAYRVCINRSLHYVHFDNSSFCTVFFLPTSPILLPPLQFNTFFITNPFVSIPHPYSRRPFHFLPHLLFLSPQSPSLIANFYYCLRKHELTFETFNVIISLLQMFILINLSQFQFPWIIYLTVTSGTLHINMKLLWNYYEIIPIQTVSSFHFSGFSLSCFPKNTIRTTFFLVYYLSITLFS